MLRGPMRVRLLATDLDGTYLSRDGSVLEENARALREASDRGVVVAFATVRKADTALRFAAPSGVIPGLVCEGGAVVVGPRGEALRTLRIAQDAADELARACDLLDLPLLATVAGVNRFGPRYRSPLATTVAPPAPCATNAEAVRGGPTRLLLNGAAAVEAAAPIVERHGLRMVRHYRADGSLLDAAVTTAGATKESGLAVLLDHLGIAAGEMLAVGDAESDLGMLRMAGVGVAVGNARPEVRAAAAWVAPRNDEAGVAAAVRRFVIDAAVGAPRALTP
jgi:hydroxymethylpyrimidine pyrophosphatase-like HAD family hydrolase